VAIDTIATKAQHRPKSKSICPSPWRSKIAEQEPQPPSRDDDDLRGFISEFDTEGFFIAGPIPEGHEGPYEPSGEELEKAIQASLEANIRMARVRADLARESLHRSLQQRKEAE
jgi:hypothetical protein